MLTLPFDQVSLKVNKIYSSPHRKVYVCHKTTSFINGATVEFAVAFICSYLNASYYALLWDGSWVL